MILLYLIFKTSIKRKAKDELIRIQRKKNQRAESHQDIIFLIIQVEDVTIK